MSFLETLERLKELEAKATKGPWRTIGTSPMVIRTKHPMKYRSDYIASLDYGTSTAVEMFTWNGGLIAESRNSLPMLLACISDFRELLLKQAKCPVCLTYEVCNHYNIEGYAPRKLYRKWFNG
jgi:hypothetical protein